MPVTIFSGINSNARIGPAPARQCAAMVCAAMILAAMVHAALKKGQQHLAEVIAANEIVCAEADIKILAKVGRP